MGGPSKLRPPEDKSPKKRGRPSIYTQALADEICRRLAAGESLRSICRDENMPEEAAVRAWALDNREGFYTHYARAREIQYLGMADELLDIADDARNDWMARPGNGTIGYELNGEHVQRSRLRSDTRKWLLSKCLPKIYGDRAEGSPDAETADVKAARLHDALMKMRGTVGAPE